MHRVHDVRQPFGREPDFGVTSMNDELETLLTNPRSQHAQDTQELS